MLSKLVFTECGHVPLLSEPQIKAQALFHMTEPTDGSITHSGRTSCSSIIGKIDLTCASTDRLLYNIISHKVDHTSST